MSSKQAKMAEADKGNHVVPVVPVVHGAQGDQENKTTEVCATQPDVMEETDDEIKGLDDGDCDEDSYTIRFKASDGHIDIPYGPFKYYRRSMIKTTMDALIAEGDTGNPADKIQQFKFTEKIKFPVKKKDIYALLELVNLFPTGPPKDNQNDRCVQLPRMNQCTPKEIEFYGIPKKPLESLQPEVIFKPKVARWMKRANVVTLGRLFAILNYFFMLPLIELCGAGLMQKYLSMGSAKSIAKKVGVSEVTEEQMAQLLNEYPEIGRI